MKKMTDEEFLRDYAARKAAADLEYKKTIPRVFFIKRSNPVKIKGHGMVTIVVYREDYPATHWLSPGERRFRVVGIESDGHNWGLGVRDTEEKAIALAESIAAKGKFPPGSSDFTL